MQSVAAPEPTLIPGLSASDFQHPEDKRASQLLKTFFAPVELALRGAFSALVEDALFMDNIASGVLVGPRQLPELHQVPPAPAPCSCTSSLRLPRPRPRLQALLRSCKLLSIETAPDLYIRQSPYPNAYTVAVQAREKRKRTGFLREMACCLAHELLSHTKTQPRAHSTRRLENGQSATAVRSLSHTPLTASRTPHAAGPPPVRRRHDQPPRPPLADRGAPSPSPSDPPPVGLVRLECRPTPVCTDVEDGCHLAALAAALLTAPPPSTPPDRCRPSSPTSSATSSASTPSPSRWPTWCGTQPTSHQHRLLAPPPTPLLHRRLQCPPAWRAHSAGRPPPSR